MFIHGYGMNELSVLMKGCIYMLLFSLMVSERLAFVDPTTFHIAVLIENLLHVRCLDTYMLSAGTHIDKIAVENI